MTGNFRGVFALMLLHPCPMCDHPLSLHVGKDWVCEECGCTDFPSKPIVSAAVCSCGHAKEAHQRGTGACGECPCEGWDASGY